MPTPQVQATLARSYLMYFITSVLGLFADSFFNVTFSSPMATYSAIVCWIAGPLLIVWAQYTSKKFSAESHEDGDAYYNHGPYKFMRNPTHLGLLILVTGYTLASGSIIFFLVTMIGYLISNIFFKKYESMLEVFSSEYGSYKNKVKRVL
jgi:protein-S-isoprenylcysteine O-methyltransferase Ste14